MAVALAAVIAVVIALAIIAPWEIGAPAPTATPTPTTPAPTPTPEEPSTTPRTPATPGDDTDPDQPEPAPTASPSPADSRTTSPTPKSSHSATPNPSPTSTSTAGPSPVPTASSATTPSATPAPTVTPSPTPSPTRTAAPSQTPTPTPSPTPTPTATPTPSPTPTPTPTSTPKPTEPPDRSDTVPVEPDDLVPGPGATQIAWQVSPGSLLLEPGDQGTLKLRAVYSDGTHTPVEIPLGATPVLVGDDVATAARGGTGFTVTAGSTIGTTLLTLTGLDGDLPVTPATIQVARLQPGVVRIANDHLLFPLPDVPASITLGVENMTRWTGVDDSGVGPFSWEDVLTRFAEVDGVVRYPVVLTGAPPATGATVVSTEGSDVMGTVVAPAGLPTLTAVWNGIPVALISVQLGDLRDVFADFSIDLDDQQVTAAGYPMRLIDSGEGGLEQLALDLDEDDETPDWLKEQLTQSAAGGGMMPGLMPMALTDSCKADPSSGMYAKFDSTFNQPDGSVATFQFRVHDGNIQALVAPFFGVPLTTLKGSMYVQPAAKGVKVDCTPWKNAWSLPLVPKPLGLAFQPMIGLYVKVSGDASVKLNKLADLDYSVKFGFGARAGFSFDVANGLQPVWEYVPPTAEGHVGWDTFMSALGLDREGTSPVGLSAEVGVGEYVGMQLGVQLLSDLAPLLDAMGTWPVISGWLRDGINQFADNLQLTFIDTRLGIKGAATFANTQAVLDQVAIGQGKSENQIGLLGVAEGKFTTEKIDKYFKVLGMFTPRVELKLFPDQKYGIASLYRHLEAGKAKVKVEGKEISDAVTAITVHPEEELVIELPVVHKPDSAITFGSVSDPPLTSADVFREDGARIPPSDQPFEVTAAGTTVALTHRFTKAECEGAYAHKNTFVMLPYNQIFGLDSPGWGGSVGVVCTKPTLGFAQTPESAEAITEVELTDQGTKTIGIVGTELRNPLGFKVETDADWLTLSAATGSIPATEEAGKASGVPVTLTADCAAHELHGRQEASLKLTETDDPRVVEGGPFELTVTVDCSESIKLLPAEIQLDQRNTQREVTLRADVNGERTWSIGASPPWLNVTLADGEDGTLPPGTSVHSVNVAVRQDVVSCDPVLGTVQGSYTVNVAAGNGTASVDGTVSYRCHDPELTLTPAAVTLTGGVEQKLTVGLRYATASTTLSIAAVGDGGDLPLTVTPATAQLANGATTQLTLTPTCADQASYTGSVVITGTGVDLPVTAAVTVRCDVSFTVSPAELSGYYGTATLAWSGFEGGIDWQVESLPSWLQQTDGTPGQSVTDPRADGSATASFSVVGLTEGTCGQPAYDRATDIKFVAQPTAADSGIGRLTRTVHYTFHRDATPDCPKGPQTAHAGGDPHLISFDGNYFDAQLLGDYVFVEPTRDDPTLPRVVARLEPSVLGSHTGGAVTSVYGVAVEIGDARVSIYAQPTFGVYVNGQPVTLAYDEPLAIGPGASVVLTAGWVGDVVTVTAGPVIVQTTRYAHIFNLAVTAPTGTAVHGFLGSPDGNPANDRDGADGAEHGPFYGYGAGREAILDFGASWRITDPARTPLTERASDYFNAQVPDAIDPEELAASEAAVRERLPQAMPPLCNAVVSDYLIEAIALEAWAFPDIGLDATIAHWTSLVCSYVVSGTVTASLDGATSVVGGLTVTVDLPGASPCTATSGTDGRYTCTLTPLTAVEAGGFTPPETGGPTATVTVSRPGGDPVGTAPVTFDELATNGQSLSATADVSVDPSVLRAAILHGTLTRDGAPLTGPVTLPVNLYKPTVYGGLRTLVVYPDADGVYSATLLLAQDITQIGLAFGNAESSLRHPPYNTPFWNLSQTGLTDARFDWDDSGYRLVFGGTVSQAQLDAGAAQTTLKVRAIVRLQDGSQRVTDVYSQNLSCTDQGSYVSAIRLSGCFEGRAFGGELELPAPATSVEVTVSSPTLDHPEVHVIDLEPGANPLMLFGQGGEGVRAASALITGATPELRDDYAFPRVGSLVLIQGGADYGLGRGVRTFDAFGWDEEITEVEWIWYLRPDATWAGVEAREGIFGTGSRIDVPLAGVTSWPLRVATFDLGKRDWPDASVLVRFLTGESGAWGPDTEVTVTGLTDGEESSDPVRIDRDGGDEDLSRVVGTAWVNHDSVRFDGWFAFPAGTDAVRVETRDKQTGARTVVVHGVDETINPIAFHILSLQVEVTDDDGPVSYPVRASLISDFGGEDHELFSGIVRPVEGVLSLATLVPFDLVPEDAQVRLALAPLQGHGDGGYIGFYPESSNQPQRWTIDSWHYGIPADWGDGAADRQLSFTMALSSALRETEWEGAVVTVTGGGEELASWKLTDVAAYADGDYAEGFVAEDFDKPELAVSLPARVPAEVSRVKLTVSFPDSDHDWTLEREIDVTDGDEVAIADIVTYTQHIEVGLAGGGDYPGPWVAGFAFVRDPDPPEDDDGMWRQTVSVPAGTAHVRLVGWLPRKPDPQPIETWVEWTEHSTGTGAGWDQETDGGDVSTSIRWEYSEPQGRAAGRAGTPSEDAGPVSEESADSVATPPEAVPEPEEPQDTDSEDPGPDSGDGP